MTLLCFLLTSTTAMGIAVYVDSFSVHYWVQAVDVGDVSMVVVGPEVEDILSSVRQIDGVSKAVLLQDSAAFLKHVGAKTWERVSVCAPSQEYLDAFPSVFTLVGGRWPQNESEIAVSLALAGQDWLNLDLGSYMTYAYRDETHQQNVTVVGIYAIPDSELDYSWLYEYLFDYDVITVTTLLAPRGTPFTLHVDVERSSLTPFDAGASLVYVVGISGNIRALDPLLTTENPHSKYNVNGLLESGILSYMRWMDRTRISQLWRATPAILLIMMVGFLAIRYNMNERRYETSMLTARGATDKDLNSIINHEMSIITALSCVLGLLFGVLASRIAIAAEGYFQFDLSLILQDPLLITREALILGLIVGIMLPLLTLVAYRRIYSTRKRIETGSGTLYRIVKGFNLVKWELLVVVFASFLMLAAYVGGVEVRRNLFFALLASMTPLPLFLGVASLVIKGIRRGANLISGGLKRIVGEVPARVGIRRIGKEASSAGPAVMVLVLAISLAWSNAVVDSSLPVTHLHHSRFAMGADVTFRLDPSAADMVDAFLQNATQHSLTLSASLVDIVTLFLADDLESGADFVAIDPTEYITIGYDHLGLRLNQSELGEFLMDLANDPTGVIITRDIADSYSFEEGDVLRAYGDLGSTEVYEFIIIGIVPAIPELLERESRFGSPAPYDLPSEGFGERRAWVHRDFTKYSLNMTADVDHYCVLSTAPGTNGTAVGEELLDSGGDLVVQSGEWGTVDYEMQYYLTQVSYHIDRAIDTMMMTMTVLTILGAFTIYAVEGVRARKREIALLKSMGASNSLVVSVQGAELLVLLCLSVLLLAIYSPLFLANSLLTAVGAYGSWSSLFPVAAFLTIPWPVLLGVLTSFLFSVAVFIAAIAALASRVNMAMALNAAWAESGPYGGDF